MNKTQAGRILTLAYFLRHEVPNKQLEMGWYAKWRQKGVDFDATKVERFNDAIEKENVCGTSACALGWAGVVWPKQWRVVRVAMFRANDLQYRPSLKSKWQSSHYNDISVLDFFGIKLFEASELFGGHCKRTVIQEANELEKVAASYGWEYAN